jgi:hypothetical protein
MYYSPHLFPIHIIYTLIFPIIRDRTPDTNEQKNHWLVISMSIIISYTRTPFFCAGRRTTDATNQLTTKWLAYYKFLKSDLLSTKCFKSTCLLQVSDFSEGNMPLFDFLMSRKEFNVYQHDIHIFMNMMIWPLMTYTVTSFGKALNVQNCLLKKPHVINKKYWWKIYKKNYDAILSKYDSAEKRYINYAYVLKNGVGRFNIFFLIFTQILLNIIRI